MANFELCWAAKNPKVKLIACFRGSVSAAVIARVAASCAASLFIPDKCEGQLGKFFEILKKEAHGPPGLFDINDMARDAQVGQTPRKLKIVESLESEGYFASVSIFSPLGIKTNAPHQADSLDIFTSTLNKENFLVYKIMFQNFKPTSHRDLQNKATNIAINDAPKKV